MKRIKIILLAFLLLIPFNNIYAAGVSVSTSRMSITVGKTATFKITASSAAGRVDISSSDNSVAKVNKSNGFLDNSSLTVKVTAKKEGTATIRIKLTDVATYSGKEITGTKTISVTVKKASATKTEVKEETPKEMKITSFKIVGYDIEFNKDLLEYNIDVSPDVNKLYIIVKGENFSATGDKEVDITNKDSVVVTLKNGKEVLNYTIKINRKVNEVVKIEEKEVLKEVVKTDNKYFYSTIGLGILCLILMVLLATSKKKNNASIEEKNITPIETTHINTYSNIPNNTATNTTINNQDNNLQ